MRAFAGILVTSLLAIISRACASAASHHSPALTENKAPY